MHIALRGAVQGVGFRPFVYRLASDMKLPGWVLNSPEGVFIEVEGEKDDLDSFLFRLQEEKPTLHHSSRASSSPSSIRRISTVSRFEAAD